MTWAPFNGIYFSIYELSKKKVSEHTNFSGLQLNLPCTAVAGTVASILTSPIDLIKTRLQVQLSNPHVFDYKVSKFVSSFNLIVSHIACQNPLDAAIKIVKREGVVALFDGLVARIIWLTPRLSLAVTIYEQLKERLILSQS